MNYSQYKRNLQIADILLLSIVRDPTCPHYSERNFERKLTRDTRQERKLPFRFTAPGESYLARREWEEIFRLACLTPVQARVIRMRLAGWTFMQIGTWRGHTKQGSMRIFLQAIRKIYAARRVYRFTGLAEVYRSEQRRGVR